MGAPAAQGTGRPFDVVLSDVDGTLLRPTHALSPRTARAARACVAGGVPFAIATGRMPSGLTGVTAALGVPVARICYSGAYVLAADGREVASVTMATDVATRALALVGELWPRAEVSFFAGKHWYAPRPDAPTVAREASIVGATPEQADPRALLAAGVAPNKLFCLCADDPGRSEEMRRVLAARLPELSVVRSRSGMFVELLPAGVSKATGAQALLRELGVPMGRALFFGDDANDLPLLVAAGRGVAMANAERDIRRAADDVAPSNADDGVAAYLERELLPYL